MNLSSEFIMWKFLIDVIGKVDEFLRYWVAFKELDVMRMCPNVISE